ncbi:putative yir4 protein, partial [Plasmodium yoelii yoelii]
CEKFMNVWEFLPDELTSDKKYQFKTGNFLDSYCDGNSCDSDIEKINGGCLYLFNQLFGSSDLFKSVANSNINIVEYIMIWLSYMLNLKEQSGNNSNLQYFYSTTINNNRYKNSIGGVTEYKNYKDLIDQKTYFLDMDKKIISNFYEAFKLLCEMYTNFVENKSYCSNCSQNANKFVNKYNEMNQNSVITSNNSYKQLLSTLSNEYNNFKNYYTSKGGNSKDIPSISSIEKIQSSEDTPSSSSITSKLFTVLSIFGAIAFFWGISYKRKNKKYKEENESLICDSKSSDNPRNSNNS